MAYGARLESVLGESPRGFESPILRREPASPPATPHPHHPHLPTRRHRGGDFDQGGVTHVSEPAVRIVPRRSLLVSALVSIVVVLVPISGVLYWFAIPRGQGGWVVLAQVIVVVASLALLFRQLTVDTVVDDAELRGRGIFSPMERIPLDRIARVDLVHVYLGQSTETVPQLLVRDAEGARLFRLRGTFWHAGDLEKIATALPVPLTVAREPLPMAEFFENYPGSAYWFENRPWLVAALIVLVLAAAVGITVGVMTLFGMPIMA